MSRQFLAESLELSGGDRGVVAVVAVVALAALAVGYVLLKEVLAAGQGTDKMQDIAKAVQEAFAAAEFTAPRVFEAVPSAGARRLV